jgi:hypothetical protein
MSVGAVQKYGVDTLEGMNAAGGGTNKPKMMGGKTYAAGGGFVGDKELYRIAANNNRGENLKEISYDPNNQAHKNKYEEIKKIAIKRGVYKPSIEMNSPNIKTNVDLNYNSPSSGSSKPINPANINDPKRGKWQYEYYEKKFKKIEEQLAIQRILSSGKGIGIKGASFGLDMGKGFGTTLKNRQSIIVPGAADTGWEPEINIGGMRYFGQVRGKDVIYSSNFAPRGRFGGGIKGGLGLKDQSYKDSPKTQMMTDDKGIPFVGYKSMRNGKLVYERKQDPPRPGTGTSNPFEAFGRAINPGAYKDNDAKLAMQKSESEKRVAATNSLESLQARGASSDSQSRMMKQIGANSNQTQNDLSYRKNEQIKYAKKVFLTPGPPTQQKQNVFFVPAGNLKPKSAFTIPKSQSAPGFSASHPSGYFRNAVIYGLK